MAFLLPGHKQNARGAATSPSSAVESGKRAAKILQEKNVQGIRKLGAERGSPAFLFSCWEMLGLLLALLAWRRATWRGFAPRPCQELCRASPARFSERSYCLQAVH